MQLLKQSLEPFSQRLKTASVWGALIGITFFICYPLTNWLTTQREYTWHLYLAKELNIPFVPEFIWFYLMLYPLLILPIFILNSEEIKLLSKKLIFSTLLASFIFILLPCSFGFERTLPAQASYFYLFQFLFSVDYPHNLVPSLHVIYASLIIFTLNKRVASYVQAPLYCLLVGIICSTLFTHQHQLLDVFSGLGLSLIINHIKGFNHEKNSD